MSEPSAWRIEKAKHLESWRTGAGAALKGGRWNSAGIAVIYSSQHLSMAMLEVLVHLPRLYDSSVRFLAVPIYFNTAKMEIAELADMGSLEADSKRSWGDDWVASGRSAILKVPSVIVPLEWNFVISPVHPDFMKIRAGEVVPISFDARLFGK